MLSNEVQPLNAESPIIVTLFGISMLSNEVQPLNAESPISVIPSGMITLLTVLSHTFSSNLPSSLSLNNLSIL